VFDYDEQSTLAFFTSFSDEEASKYKLAS